jgi:hypothetical protein
LELAIRERPHSLRLIANRLLDAAEEGDLPSAREVADRLDGKAVTMIDRHDVVVLIELSDAQLNAIAAGLWDDDELQIKVIPPPSKD